MLRLHCPGLAQDIEDTLRSGVGGEPVVGLGGLCPKKALLCYASMPAGSSIMLNLEAYYARNMPAVCL